MKAARTTPDCHCSLFSYHLMVMLVMLALPIGVLSQTSATATVSGTVTDPQGAVIGGASVEMTDLATNVVRRTTTNEGGQYIFTAVTPGVYKITVSMQGFRQAVIPRLKVDVAKAHLVNVTLEVGAVAETIEVTAGAGVELQTTNATVGNVLGGEQLLRTPIPDRQVTSLILLQPLAMPGRGVDNSVGGQVAGARSDQNTFLLDGGDITSDVEGTGGYNTQFVATPQGVVPTPAESIEEFRVSTTNANATFGRSDGAQVSLVTKRGTNSVHGSAYWYHQNDNLNANRWELNRTCSPAAAAAGRCRPELKDNRFGFSGSGPIVRDSTWIFAHYEGRRFPRTRTISRIVPTPTMRQGILRFRDAAGNVVSYDLKTSRLCGDGTQPCDPRGIGMSPVISRLWSIYPQGNDATLGDGLNTIGLTVPIDNSISNDFAVVRFDQKISDKWNFFASYRYARTKEAGFQQVDIAGLTGSGIHPTRKNPLQPRYVVAGFDGQITPNLTSETRISWYRHWWEWATQAPFPQVQGTNAALDVGQEGAVGLVSEPINIDTQNARSRVWNGRDTYVAENMSWLKGPHTIQFGGNFRNQKIFHMRTDKVTGGLSTGTIYYLEDGSFISIPVANRPPTCGGAITTNCLRSGDITRWNQLYATTLGIMDRAVQLLSRDGNLNPRPLGTPLTANVTIRAYEFYAQDIWRVTPSLTLTYGLSYQVQVPPVERDGLQSVMVFRNTQEPVFLDQYYRRRAEAAQRGEIFNPEIAYAPIRHIAAQKYVYNIDWNNFSPRLAVAWNPAAENWFFGNRKTVIRGGYGVTYTRMNGVGLVMTPILGVGLGEILACRGPNTAGVCTGALRTPTDAFRVGVDGAGVSLPAPGPARIPFTVAAPFGETRSFMIDPGLKLGKSHSFDVTWQRELPGNLLLEFGYVGRVARNLQQNADLNAMPFFMRDPASGTTLAQAFDAVAQQIRAGASVTPQPWFENQLRAACQADPDCRSYPSVTAYLADGFATEFSLGDLASVFLFGIDPLRLAAGLVPYNNIQVLINNLTTDGGKTDYHAGFISLNKRMSHGLTFNLNYTWSHSIDLFGLNQENTQYSFTSPFFPEFDKEPSLWDRRHVLNFYWYYDLPFGRGQRWSVGGRADKLLGGWYTAGIFTASSGLPLCVFAGSNYGALTAGTCGIPIKPMDVKASVNKSAGSGGVGTTGDPARRGSGLNLFRDPKAVFDNFRYPLMTRDTRFGFGALYGLPRWNLDLSLGKKTALTESTRIVFSFDFLNIFNHRELNDPGLDLTNPATFGVLGSQFGNPRTIQFGFRFEF